VRYLAIVAIQCDDNRISDFDMDRALELVARRCGIEELI